MHSQFSAYILTYLYVTNNVAQNRYWQQVLNKTSETSLGHQKLHVLDFTGTTDHGKNLAVFSGDFDGYYLLATLEQLVAGFPIPHPQIQECVV